jgi:hypothetical protein
MNCPNCNAELVLSIAPAAPASTEVPVEATVDPSAPVEPQTTDTPNE